MMLNKMSTKSPQQQTNNRNAYYSQDKKALYQKMLASGSCTTSSDIFDLIDMEMQFLSRIMTTIESQQWEALGNAILNNPDVFRMFARSIASSLSKYMNGMTM